MDAILNNIRKKFKITDVIQQRDDLVFVGIDREQAVSLVTYLRDHERFSHFVLLAAVDWIEKGSFQLTYILHNHDIKRDLGISTLIPREGPVMESAHHLWEQVATYQRELYEMFGIEFPGSPGLTEQFLLEGWDDVPPMRREFDTMKYSEETYFPRPGRKTNKPKEYMRKKLYPDDE